jgi:FixJ family two-component response regulator
MKAGAFDFLQKPVDPDELTLVVRRAAERREPTRACRGSARGPGTA